MSDRYQKDEGEVLSKWPVSPTLESKEEYTIPNGQVSGRRPPQSNNTISDSKNKTDRSSGLTVNRPKGSERVFYSNKTNYTDSDTDDEILEQIEPFRKIKRYKPNTVNMANVEEEYTIPNGQVSGRCLPKSNKTISDSKSKTDRSSFLTLKRLQGGQRLFYSNSKYYTDSDRDDEIPEQIELIRKHRRDKPTKAPTHHSDVEDSLSEMSKRVVKEQGGHFRNVNVVSNIVVNTANDEKEYTIPNGQVSGRCLPKSNKNISDSKSKTDRSSGLTVNRLKGSQRLFYSNIINYTASDTDDEIPEQIELIRKHKRDKPNTAPANQPDVEDCSSEMSKRVVKEQGSQFQNVNVISNTVVNMANDEGEYTIPNGQISGRCLPKSNKTTSDSKSKTDMSSGLTVNRLKGSQPSFYSNIKKYTAGDTDDEIPEQIEPIRKNKREKPNIAPVHHSDVEIFPEAEETTGFDYIQSTRSLEVKGIPLTQCVKNVRNNQDSQKDDSSLDRDNECRPKEKIHTSSKECSKTASREASNEQETKTKHIRTFFNGTNSYYFSIRDEIISFVHRLSPIKTEMAENVLRKGTFEHLWRLKETGSLSVPNCVDIRLMKKYFIVSADNKIKKNCRISGNNIDSMKLEGAGRMCCIKKSARIAVIQTTKYISCLETHPRLYVVYRIDMKHQYNSICHLDTYANCGDGLPNPMHVFATTFTKRREDTGQQEEIIMQVKPKQDVYIAQNRFPVYTENSSEIQLPHVSKICSLHSVWRAGIHLIVGCYDSVACIRIEDKHILWKSQVDHSVTDVAFMYPNILVCVQDENRIAAIDYKTGKEVIKNMFYPTDDKILSPHRISVCGDDVLMKGYSNDKWSMLTVIEHTQTIGLGLVKKEHTILK